jgi:hypothetical protein
MMRSGGRALITGGALFLLGACVEAPAGISPRAAPDARSLDLTNRGQATETFYGAVTVQPADTGSSIIVVLDGGDRPGLEDEIADQVFVMQRYPGSGRIEAFRIDGATLRFRRRGVLIESPASVHAWGFFMRGNGGEQVSEAMVRERGRPLTQRWNVFGISRRTVHWPMENGYLGRARVGELSARCGGVDRGILAAAPTSGERWKLGVTLVSTRGGRGENFVGFLAQDCQSGGVGSTSCTQSCAFTEGSCSVDCNSASYACCNSVGCSCTCMPSGTGNGDSGGGAGGGSGGSGPGQCGPDEYAWYSKGEIVCKSYMV